MAAIIFLALGALMLYFAVEIGMRRRIAFLHDYHYQNMKEEDITPYLHLMGVGLAVVGISAGVVWRSASGNRSHALCSVSL